jgi:hypothetical protein
MTMMLGFGVEEMLEKYTEQRQDTEELKGDDEGMSLLDDVLEVRSPTKVKIKQTLSEYNKEQASMSWLTFG